MNLAAELAQMNPSDALTRALQIIDHQTIELTQKSNALEHAEHTIKALTFELAHKKRAMYGAKSEAMSAEQRDLFNENMATDFAAIEAELEAEQDNLAMLLNTSSTKKPRTRAGHQALPAHLPRIMHRHEPESCTCTACNKPQVKIGEDISEQLDVEPARFFVHQHIRPQYACKSCETITAAPVPPAIIDGGMAANGLLAWLIVNKYVDHLPLYRVERIATRDGVILVQSTLCDWVGKVGVELQPLADRLPELLRARSILHADETPVSQLNPGAGKTKRAYLWAYRTGDLTPEPRIVVFDYSHSIK
jgi:transposase